MLRTIVRLLAFVLVFTAARGAFAQRELLTTMGARHTLSIDQVAGFRVNSSGFSYAGPIGFASQSYTETDFNNRGDTTTKTTSFWFAPSADFFIIDHLSLGGVIELTTQSQSVTRPTNGNATQTIDHPTTTGFAFIPRVGYLVALSDRFGIWPRGGIGYASRQSLTQDTDPAAVERFTTYGFLIDIDVGFLYRPVEPVFFHLGPELTTTLGASHSLTRNGTTLTANASIFQFAVLGGVGVFFEL
jgi:hypothetical protein